MLRLAFVVAAWVCASALVRPPTAAAQEMDSTQAVRYQLADTFIRAGQFDRAISLLEDLHATAPENYAFYNRLREAYESVKRYDDAAELITARMGNSPTASLLSDLARIHFLKDDEESAYETWDRAIATDPDAANTYRVVYQSLLDLRQFERAISVLGQAREKTGDPALFRSDLAYLNSLTGRHAEAMDEYLSMLVDNQQQLGFVRSRLSRFVEQEEALRASIASAERAVRREPLNRAFRELLGWLYVEAEDYANAFDEYRAIDRLESESGQVLFQFALMAADAGAYDVASEAYREILARYPDAPSSAQALAALGEMHERWADQIGERAVDEAGNRIAAPHYDRALETYRTFLQQHPNHVMFPEVLRRIGHLQQDVFFELGAAESTLQRVVSSYPGTAAADEAEYDLARAALMRGQIDEARLRFNRLIERLRTGDLAELARYKLAQIHFFAGEFEAAQTLVDVIDVNTSTDVSNDAIELKVLLIENRGPDSLDVPLKKYARALFAEAQRQPQSALDTVRVLLQQFPNHPLADDARYLRARILRSSGQSRAALDAFAEIPLMHAQSYLADKALFAAAEIRQFELDDADGAIEMYQRILADYPGSLLANDARDRIRRLRGDGV